MTAAQSAAFDNIALRYDALWSDTPVGRAQRSAVWSRIDPLFDKCDVVLDLGCGTGVDSLHLQSRGVSVLGVDASKRMIEIARERGIQAECCPIEHLERFNLKADGVVSNFGALNCLRSLTGTAGSLARIVRSGGYLALCFFNRICLWEIAFYLLRLQPGKALRRLKGYAESSIGATVFYPSARAISSAFEQNFRLLKSYGIGLFVPPSCVTFLKAGVVDKLASLDERTAHWPAFRAMADHRLYIFERL